MGLATTQPEDKVSGKAPAFCVGRASAHKPDTNYTQESEWGDCKLARQRARVGSPPQCAEAWISVCSWGTLAQRLPPCPWLGRESAHMCGVHQHPRCVRGVHNWVSHVDANRNLCVYLYGWRRRKSRKDQLPRHLSRHPRVLCAVYISCWIN